MTVTLKLGASHAGARLDETGTSAFVVRELEPPEYDHLSLLSDDAVKAVLTGKGASAEYRSLCQNNWCAGAFSDETLVGVIGCQLIDIPGIAETSVFVIEARRFSGIGAALLQAAESWARECGCNALRIHCPRSNWSMRALLERVGARLDLVLGQIVAEIRIETFADKATVS